jgi:HK97 family phage prohead protease
MQNTRDFSLKIKALDQATGSFTGLASTYGGPPDLVGDIIAPNAYAQSIASQGAGLPLLWCHDQSQPLGLAKVSDSAAGLVLNGSLLMSDPAAQRAYAHLKAGSIKGLSIGYSTPPESSGKVIYNNDGSRTLKEVMLHECSLVAVPANPRAQVTSVKSLAQVEHLLHGIRPNDVTGGTLTQLRSIDLALKSLLKKNADGCDCSCDDCVAGNCEDCSDDCAECENCEGCLAARSDASDLDDLKAFAMQLKKLAT